MAHRSASSGRRSLTRRSKLSQCLNIDEFGVVLTSSGASELPTTRKTLIEPISGLGLRKGSGDRPGELVHLDVKKQAKIPEGGGSRVHGRSKEHHGGRDRTGLRLHPLGHRRLQPLAYSEVHDDEKAVTNLAFWRRAKAFFAT